MPPLISKYNKPLPQQLVGVARTVSDLHLTPYLLDHVYNNLVGTELCLVNCKQLGCHQSILHKIPIAMKMDPSIFKCKQS